MKTQHLFCREECMAIEDKFGSHIVYRAFRSPSLKVANHAKVFALHPAELFYQCIYTVDELKGKTTSEQVGYCKYELYEELYAHFCTKVDLTDEQEIKQAVFMVLQAVAEFLVYGGNRCYLLAGLLKEQIPEELSFKLNTLFRQGFSCIDVEEATEFMSAYLKSGECLSEKINAVLDEQKEAPQAPEKSVLRIAEDKKRSVVVTLKAIIELGWIVDEKGKQPKNKEKAVNEILRLAFGESRNTALSQTVKPSNDLDFEGSMKRIGKELSDKIKSFAPEKENKR